jgi:uncharacterized protein YecT (DUF1311 family)
MNSVRFTAILLFGVLMRNAHAEQHWKPDHNYNCKSDEVASDRTTIQCSLERLQVWDGRLNQAYKEALAALSSPDYEVQIAAFKKAQRLWVQYRDANCDYYNEEPGTIHRSLYAECMRKMTQDRAIELQQGLTE